MVGEQLGEATKSKGINVTTKFSIEMLSNLAQAMDNPDMTPELAEILSTDQVPLLYKVTTDIKVGDR